MRVVLFAPGSLLLAPPPPFCSRTLGTVGADPFPGWQKGRRRREREIAGERGGRDEAGAEVGEDSLPGLLRLGRKEAEEAGYVAEVICGPEWEGEPREGGLGRGLKREGILGEGPEGERGS